MNKKILLLLLGLVLISGCGNNLNEQTMQKICDENYSGNAYLWKSGWSDNCSFDVYVGTCVERGLSLEPSGYYLVDGKSIYSDEIDNMFDVDKANADSTTDKVWKQWHENACKKFLEVKDE